MMTMFKTIDEKLNGLRKLSDEWLSHILLLVIRLYMANIFFMSGFGKLKDTLNGNFGDVVFLFTEIHPVPILPPNVAAVFGMGGEVVFGALLALGLFGRAGALALLAMTLVIEFGVPAVYEISNPDHYFWMMLLAVPLFFGAGKLSGDHFLLKYIRKA